MGDELVSESTMLIPPWLETLLSTTNFFSICRSHEDAARNECNMYCVDCNLDAAFCFCCRSADHKDHNVIQIRRSSYHEVVRVSEIEKFFDIDGVQTYVINSARVLFLNERPQPKGGGGISKGSGSTSGGSSSTAGSHICEICGRTLLDSCRFCSLGCKVVGMRKNRNASFVVDERKREVKEGEFHEESTKQQQKQNVYPFKSPIAATNINTTPTSRRRKGIPHRAPFGS
ncbi:uncharacterized protein LOC113314181 isoform X1 [Papaver somniferum]|uniref:uncharacterized protein LOC113314181 isoform X1 n=1 Tax=Papaver somniferum TaxID=3469 RepID=UPI000E7031EB|nr:uncharacterized protein LOC113314181 isoform X1 [Papaver somniferum]